MISDSICLDLAKLANFGGLPHELITFNSFFRFYRSFAVTFLMRFMASLIFSSLVA
jgi:hypothetical protein